MSKKIKEDLKKTTFNSPTSVAIMKLQTDTTKILQATQQTPPSSNPFSPLPDGAHSKEGLLRYFGYLEDGTGQDEEKVINLEWKGWREGNKEVLSISDFRIHRLM